jgi:hypothetical protein
MKNFKQACFGVAALAVMTTGTTLTGVSPAQALIIGGDPTYSPLTSLPTTLTVDGEFHNNDLSGGFTNVSGILVNSVGIKSGSSIVGFNANYDATAAFISNFQYQGVAAVLNLFAGQRVLHTIDTTAPSTFTSTVNFDIDGEIRALVGGQLLGTATGGFSANKSFLDGVQKSSNFSLDIQATPVPTPAVLPGLLALGAGVLRKRKSKEVVEA